MIDLNNLGKYRENNRIEAKKALGGLPHSIWETYSAFANTLGGIILLGVEEHRDKSLHAVDLPDPEAMIEEFWSMVNNARKASVNVLAAKDVVVERVNGKRIIVISVPRADRSNKPVYIDGDPRNSYRRNGEGDYKCTDEELRAMRRDASAGTQDMLVFDRLGTDVLNAESLRSYRRRMRAARPGHVWDSLEDEDFFLKIGAIGVGKDGKRHPTSAGLLMFGNEREIVREYPRYSLEYREEYGDLRRRTDRIVSSSGDWSGNVYDFYFRVCRKLQLGLKIPFEAEDGDGKPVRKALREALANCLINADYYGEGGVAVIRERNAVTMSNPGGFRIGLDEARSGGFSDPRNGTMHKMLNMIGIGERVGSGIPNILRVWHDRKWAEPIFTQSFDPDRTALSLPFEKTDGKKQKIKTSGKRDYGVQKEMIVAYLTDRVSAKSSEIAELTGVSKTRARAALNKLISEEIVVAEGANRNRTYRLKS